MAKVYISNAISLNMVSNLESGSLEFIWVPAQEVANYFQGNMEVISSIGHADMAKVVSNDLGVDISPNRINTPLEKGDVLLVAQYVGPRLAEGAVSLPEGATIRYAIVKVR